MVAKVFKQKHFRNHNLLDSKPRSGDSFAWKSITGVLQIFKSGLNLSIGTEWKWKYTDSGIYSVKSDYEVARQWILFSQDKGEEVSDWNNITRTWSNFWKIRVPDSVKLVTWRMFHNSLPLFMNLLKKGCRVNTECNFCGFDKEDACYTFDFLIVDGLRPFGVHWV